MSIATVTTSQSRISLERKDNHYKVHNAEFYVNGRRHAITRASFYPKSYPKSNVGPLGIQGIMNIEIDNAVYLKNGRIVNTPNGAKFFGPSEYGGKSYGGLTKQALETANDVIVEVASIIQEHN